MKSGNGINDWDTPEGREIIKIQIVDCLLDVLHKTQSTDLATAVRAAELIGKTVHLWDEIPPTQRHASVQLIEPEQMRITST